MRLVNVRKLDSIGYLVLPQVLRNRFGIEEYNLLTAVDMGNYVLLEKAVDADKKRKETEFLDMLEVDDLGRIRFTDAVKRVLQIRDGDPASIGFSFCDRGIVLMTDFDNLIAEKIPCKFIAELPVDDMRRIKLPREIMQQYGLAPDSGISFFEDGSFVALRPFEPGHKDMPNFLERRTVDDQRRLILPKFLKYLFGIDALDSINLFARPDSLAVILAEIGRP